MIAPHTADAIGFVGALIVLGGFGYQTLRKAAPDLWSNATNFVGASLLALSLAVNYNLPALTLEIAWAAIALIGLGRTLVTRR
uniref:CBU_0592 family membrane protein n=1 Tax=uncultured Sphingomonas sp. TaxID=158754 RepID=UPI0035CBD853